MDSLDVYDAHDDVADSTPFSLPNNGLRADRSQLTQGSLQNCTIQQLNMVTLSKNLAQAHLGDQIIEKTRFTTAQVHDSRGSSIPVDLPGGASQTTRAGVFRLTELPT